MNNNLHPMMQFDYGDQRADKSSELSPDMTIKASSNDDLTSKLINGIGGGY